MRRRKTMKEKQKEKYEEPAIEKIDLDESFSFGFYTDPV
jgi:hypothetical protein